MRILVTGGAGFIGSHTSVELLEAGYEIIIVDNFSNSKKDVIEKIKQITKKDFKFYDMDICDKSNLVQIFDDNVIDAVIHFAGYKAVGESVKLPLKYYKNNLISTINLLEVMSDYNCKKFVFSSSATVYGTPKELPIKEDFELSTTNPYGTTKLMIENILRDVSKSDNDFEISVLRYFNPIGAHVSGLIGENPNGIPNNLIPYILKVANKESEFLNIYGNDYPTKDGTGVRDYIHVVDLSIGHIKAIENIEKGINFYNLGTGFGYSVLDVVNTFSEVNGVEIPYKFVSRRDGDIASCYADPTLAYNKLGFKAEKKLEDMCKDAYQFLIKSKNNNN